MNHPAEATVIRTLLEGLYKLSGYLAGFFLLAIALTIVGQVAGRFVGLTIDATELAGFCLAASTFLGLAFALRAGSHIRINLLIRHFGGGLKTAVELWCSGVGLVASGYFAYQTILMTWQSYRFEAISPGLIAAPFWIPQSGMALGLVILTVAFVDEFVSIARGGAPGYEEPEEPAAMLEEGEEGRRPPAEAIERP
jgi:TRAP-type C4-dicarboxylate transport system permease small subunit